MTTQRPTGVTILAVLQFIGGILSLFVGISGILFGGLMAAGVAGDVPEVAAAAEYGPLLVAGGVVAIISGIIGLIAGYGLFTLKGWGWILAFVFSALNIIRSILNLVAGVNIPGAIVGIVISGLILYYLNRPHVKRAFGKA
jgi:hypothetical protein